MHKSTHSGFKSNTKYCVHHTEVSTKDRAGFCQSDPLSLLTISKASVPSPELNASLVRLCHQRAEFPRPECQSSATKMDGYFNDDEC